MKLILKQGADELDASKQGSNAILAKLSELLFIETIRNYVENNVAQETGWLSGLSDKNVAKCLNAIHSAPYSDWSVTELSRAAGCSRSALAEKFKRLMGCSVMRYLADWRIYLAAQELRHTDMPIIEIAIRARYESESAFGRAFKRFSGMPPGAYRRQIN